MRQSAKGPFTVKVVVCAFLGWGVVTANQAVPPTVPSRALQPLTAATIADALRAKRDAKRQPSFTVTMGAAGQAAPVTATVRDTLTGDVNSDGQAGPGDTLTYTATLTANGANATGVTYTAPLDPNTTLVAGSLRAAPVSVNDAYAATQNTPLVQPAATGVLANDFLGMPAATVTAFQNPTPHGTVTVAPNGSFTYSPATGYSGPDTFTYTITNAGGTNTATVAIDVSLPASAVDDTFTATKDVALVVAAPGVLANDAGAPAPTVTPATTATSQGGSVTIAANGSFTYTPPASFVSPPEDTFTYAISNAAGNSSATVHITVDAAPAVIGSFPTANAEQVALDTNITVAFSELVTVTANAFRLACPAAGAAIPVVNITGPGPAATFVLDPSSLMPVGTPCQLTVVADQVHDADGNDPPDSLAADAAITFVTDRAPTVVTTTPATGSTGFALNGNLTITFSEPVNVTGNWFQIVCSVSGTRNPADTTVTGGPTTFTIDPTNDFQPGDTCTATIVAAQVSDQDLGDPPDTMAADSTFTFAMDAAPSVATTVPANGATSVATNSNLTVTFSEPVNLSGSWLFIGCSSSGARTLADVVVTGGPTTFTINPNSDFVSGETCNWTIQAPNVSDQDANDPPDQMAANVVVSFTMETAPSVATSTPSAGAFGVAANANIIIAFSEPVNATNASLTITCTTSGVHTVTASGGPTTWTFDPDTDFAPGDVCTALVVAAQVTDQDAVDPPDTMVANVAIGFSVDQAPSVTATTPANAAADRTSTTDITVTFSEPVTVNGSWFTIACTVSGPHTATVTDGPSTWTLNPDTDFTQGETCTVTIVAAQVSDTDPGDPPDHPLADYVFSFAIDAAPGVTGATPANGATGVPLGTDLTVTFSEPVNVTGNWFQIVCALSGTRAVGDTVVTGGPTTFTINPNTNFGAGEVCTTTVFAAQVADQDSNDPPDAMVANHVFAFSTDAAPGVTTTTPVDGAVSILSNANVDITFSEPVNAVGGSFTLSCAVSGAHTFVLSGGPVAYTLNPDTDFTPGELCTTTVLAAGVSDVDANDPPDTMLANYVFSFTIEAAPFVASSTPADTGVLGTTQNLSITFNEPVNVTGNWFQLVCPSATQNVADTNVTTSDNTTFTIDPNATFVTGEGPCTLTVFAAQVTDQDSNDPPDNMVTDAVINFTIDVAPTVQLTDPVNGATNAGPTQNITITFSEPVNVSGTWFSITCTTSGSHTATVSGGPTTYILDPNSDFTSPETCTVTVFGAQVADQDTADPPDTMAADYVFSFGTDAAPSVTATTPPNGAVDVPGNANVSITFSEPVNVTGTWFTIGCTVSGAHTAAVSGGPTTFTLNPNVDFASTDLCTVTILAAQVTDQDANDPPDNMDANYVFSFAIDAAPQVTTTLPANGATNLAANTTITINFTEPVNVAAGGVTIGCPAAVPFTPALPQGPLSSLVLTPSTPLPGGSTCTVTVVAANIHDVDTNDPPDLLDGNGDGTPGDNYVFSFTVDAAPTVQSSVPQNGTTVATDTNITITFSEQVTLGPGPAFTLNCPSGTPIPFTNTTGTGPALSFVLDPTANLPAGVTCFVAITAADVHDADSNDPPDTMTAGVGFNFFTDAAPHVTVPTTPANGATNVAPSSNITIAFSELVNVAAGGITVECPVGTPIAFTPTLPQNGISSIVIDPTTSLPGNSTCTVTVVATNVTDADAIDPPDQLDGNNDGVPGDNHVFSFQVAPEAVDDSYNVSPHLTLTVDGSVLAGVKANDNPNTVTITGFGNSLATANGTVPNGTNTIATTLGTGGVVKLNADGTFTYIPPPDIVNQTDHFFYTVTGGDTADVSLVIQNQTPLIWFVDQNYGGANGTPNGTQGRPFTALTGAGSFDASALPDNNTNEVVFIRSGPAVYPCGLTLVTGQRIVGDGSSSDLATIAPLTPVTGSSLPAFSGTPPLLQNSTGSCITLGSSGNNTIRGVMIDPNTGAATAISGTGFGTATVLETLIGNNITTGRALNLTTGALAVTLNSLRSTGSTTNGITLTGTTGTVTVNNVGSATTLSGAASATIAVVGGSVSMTLNGNVSQANGAPLLSVSGGHAGTLTFQNGTLNATAGTGLQFDDADGVYSFNGTTTLNGGDAGVDILNGAGGSFTFASGTTITNPSGIAFNVDGQSNVSTASVTFNGNITQAVSALAAVQAHNHGTGTLSFQTGTLSVTSGTGLQFDNADGTYNFNTSSGTTSLSAGNAGVDIITGSAGTFGFGRVATPSAFTITTPSGIAFLVSTGAPNVTYSGLITQANSQRLISVSDTAGGSVTFNSPQANSYVSGGSGILIDGAAGNVTVNNGDLNGSIGIEIDGDATNNATGTFTFNNVTIDVTGTALIVNGDVSGAGGDDVTGTIDLNNVDITNPGGLVASIQGLGGGSIDFDSASAISRTNAGQGFIATSNAGGTVTVNSAVKTLNTGVNPAVTFTGNGTTLNFVGGNLDIDTTTGAGFTATGGGTVTVQGSNNTVNSTTGTAVNIAGTTIGASNVTFQSVSSGGSGNAGVILNATGSSGGLKVTGLDGGDADTFADAGSGGTIANKTGGAVHSISGSLAVPNGTTGGVGLYLRSTQHASFAGMQLNDFSNFAVFAVDSSDITITDSVVSGANGDETAIDEGAVSFYNQTGTANITRTSISGGFENNLMVLNTTGTLNRFTVSSSTFGFNNTTNGNNSILVESQNSGTTLNFTLEGSLIKGSRADWINASNNSTSTMDLVIGGTTLALGNTFDNLGANAHPGAAAGGNRVVLGSVGTQTFDINNNTLKGSKGEAIRVRSTATGATTGNATGYVRNNTVGVAGTANSGSSEGSGIFVFGDGGSDMTVVVDNNDVFQYNNSGIRFLFGDELNDGSLFNVTVTNNTVNTPGNINNGFNGLLLTNGSVSATDNFTTRINIANNDLRGGGRVVIPDPGGDVPNDDDLRVNQRFATHVEMPGYLGAPTDNAAVVTYLLGKGNLVDPNSPPNTDISAQSNVAGGYFNTPGGAPPTTPPFPLLAEGGEKSRDNPAVGGEIVVTTAVDVMAAAHDRFNAPAKFEGRIAFTDLPAAQLGSGTELSLTFDRSGAGWGWFVDPTPDRDEEFGPPSPVTGERVAKAGGPAAGKMDLLTALMHEIGHARGDADLDPIAHAGELMAATLPAGVRRGPLPLPLLASRSIGNSALPMVLVSGETVTVSVGTVPAGKSVVITYQATINANPITGPGFSLTHQGTVTGTNFATIVTDDPDTSAVDDSTITAMVCPTITVAPASLPQAILGNAFGPVTFTATGGNGTMTFAQTGTLPAGLTWDAATATLSGTPTEVGTFTFTITATDQNDCTGSQSYTLTVAGGRAVMTGAGQGGGPHVRRFNAIDGGVPSSGALTSFFAFDPSFSGGVRVAEGDVNLDGEPDYITGAGPGATPTVRVFDGATGALLSSFLAFEPSFTGGVYVAAGDVNGDNFADIVVGSGAGHSGHVKVFSGMDGSLLRDTSVFASFTGGVRVAAGDVNGDGFADLVAGTGPGPASTVTILSGLDLSVLRTFTPYGAFPGGVFVAAGDVTGDGFADVITGADAGGGPHVQVFDGVTGAATLGFFAFDVTFSGGVRVAAGDVTGDGKADIIAGAGPGGTPEVRVFNGADAALIGTQMAYDPAFPAGIYVATAVPVNRMSIDLPSPSATVSGPFTVAGWAFEENAAGAGIDAIHAWAIPIAGGAAQFLGAATLGIARPDIGVIFGPKYANTGYAVNAPALPAGTYDVYVFAHSPVSGTFNMTRIVRIVVAP